MKKAIMWYIKWTVVGNGILTLLAFVIGNMIKAGLLGDNGFTQFMKWYNDMCVIVMKSNHKRLEDF